MHVWQCVLLSWAACMHLYQRGGMILRYLVSTQGRLRWGKRYGGIRSTIYADNINTRPYSLKVGTLIIYTTYAFYSMLLAVSINTRSDSSTVRAFIIKTTLLSCPCSLYRNFMLLEGRVHSRRFIRLSVRPFIRHTFVWRISQISFERTKFKTLVENNLS